MGIFKFYSCFHIILPHGAAKVVQKLGLSYKLANYVAKYGT